MNKKRYISTVKLFCGGAGAQYVKLINQKKRVGRRHRGYCPGSSLYIKGQIGTVATAVLVRTSSASSRSSSSVSGTTGGSGAQKVESGKGGVSEGSGAASGTSAGTKGATGGAVSTSRSRRAERKGLVHVLIVAQKKKYHRKNGIHMSYGQGGGILIDLKRRKPIVPRILSPIAKDFKRLDYKQDRLCKNVLEELRKYC